MLFYNRPIYYSEVSQSLPPIKNKNAASLYLIMIRITTFPIYFLDFIY